MKALTIHQPYAALIAHGLKIYETRSWSTRYRGEIAIHAGKSQDSLKWLAHGIGAQRDEVKHVVHEAELWQEIRVLGAVIATGTLSGIFRAEDIREYSGTSRRELLLGNYYDGRFGWEITNVQLLPEPIYCTGGQGLWDCEEVSL